MAAKTIISKTLSVLLLLVFMVSIVPRNYLHDALAGHSDSFYLLHHSDIAAIEKQGFQCDQFQLVVNLPYEQIFPTIIGCPCTLAGADAPIYSISIFTSDPVHTSLRGPPSQA